MSALVVKIRLIASSEEAVNVALDELSEQYRDRLQNISDPKKGSKKKKHGADWLVYADLIVEQSKDSK